MRLLAATLPDLVPRLRRLSELYIDDAPAGLLLKIAPATIDRRLKADRAKLDPRGRSHTKLGTLLKDSISMRTWAEWDEARPGIVEIDLVAHEGGNSRREFCYILDITCALSLLPREVSRGEFKRSAQQRVHPIGGGVISEDFPGPTVEFESDHVEVILSEVGHAGALGEVLTQ